MRTFAIILLLSACHPRSTIDFEADLGGADSGHDGGSDLDTRVSAIKQTISDNSSCNGLLDFYWEIGDVSGPLAAGQVGTLYGATSSMKIASASKFVWGAYVLERFSSDLGSIDFPSMSMQAGYTSLDYSSCVNASSVADCLSTGKNGTLDPTMVGQFYYNGGHFQHYAVELGLGADDNSALTAEIVKYLGADFQPTYASPQLAAGLQATPQGYAAFLRKILAGQLVIHDHLGEMPVCTLPGASCPTAQYSPAAPYAWHYSYAHWVEDEPTTGDGAFSSAGAFGFYPWIDASKTYYGILARYSLLPSAAIQSAECGRVIRKAFMTAMPQ